MQWARQACQIDPAAISGVLVRASRIDLAVALQAAGEVTAAQRICAGWPRAREAGDLYYQAHCLDVLTKLGLQAGLVSASRRRPLSQPPATAYPAAGDR